MSYRIFAFFLIILYPSSAVVATPPSMPIKIYEVAKVLPRDVIKTSRLIGTLQPTKQAELTAQAQGFIKLIAKESAKVEKDAVIAELNNENERQQFELAQHKEKIAHEQYDRMKKLQKTKSSSQRSTEIAEESWLSAKIALSQAEKAYRQTIIHAPFDGVVGVFRVIEGASVAPGDKIVTIYDDSSRVVEFNIPKNILGLLRLDTPVFYEKSQGKIISIQHAIDKETQMGLGRASANDVKACIGSTVGINVPIQEHKNALSIPTEAIFYDAGKSHVYVIMSKKEQEEAESKNKDKKKEEKKSDPEVHMVKKVEIEVGLEGHVLTEVTKGLDKGQEVILRGQSMLYPSAQVKTKLVEFK